MSAAIRVVVADDSPFLVDTAGNAANLSAVAPSLQSSAFTEKGMTPGAGVSFPAETNKPVSLSLRGKPELVSGTGFGSS